MNIPNLPKTALSAINRHWYMLMVFCKYFVLIVITQNITSGLIFGTLVVPLTIAATLELCKQYGDKGKGHIIAILWGAAIIIYFIVCSTLYKLSPAAETSDSYPLYLLITLSLMFIGGIVAFLVIGLSYENIQKLVRSFQKSSPKIKISNKGK